jgi:sugar phosphate isomerase/epimerase
MKRRVFFENTGKFGIGLSLMGVTSCLNSNKNKINAQTTINVKEDDMFFTISLAQWSLHKAIRDLKTLPVLDFAAKARELEIDAIEYVSQLYDLGEQNQLATLDKLVKELNKRSADNGITNVLIMIDHEGDLAVIDKSGRDKAINNHMKWVDAAAGLGCSSVRVNLFGGEAEKDPKVWHETAIDGLGRLSEYAAKTKVNVIVENHGGLTSDAGKLAAVIKAIDMKNCGTLPDFGNFCVKRVGGERWGSPCIEQYDMYKGVGELMPYAKGVSAKSYEFDAEGNEVNIDFVKMMQVVKDSGFKGHVGIEYEGDKHSEEEGIKATKRLLEKVAKKLS